MAMRQLSVTVRGARFVWGLAILVSTTGIQSAAQTDPWVGTWTAREQDRGVTVTLTVGQSSTLVIPGVGPGGKVAALTLVVRNFRRAAERASFTVDLPDNGGVIEWELRSHEIPDVATLRALTIDGEPVDDDTASWILRHQRGR
jgi:hypothetical protein